MSERYRADYRGRLFNALWPFTRWVLSNVTATVGAVLFFGLERTEIIGRRNVPRERNTLLLANHQSLIDSFLIGFGAFYGPSFLRPWLIPWNPAAEENFYKNAYQAWWSDQWKCIPVAPGRRDMRALYRMIRALGSGTMILFPEGTRSRSGRVGKGRPGAGLVALAEHPTIIPVTIEGMQDVLPIGAPWPKPFKRVTIVYGPPLDYDEFIGVERTKQNAQAIVDRAIAVIRYQHDWVRRYRAGEVGREMPPWEEPGYAEALRTGTEVLEQGTDGPKREGKDRERGAAAGERTSREDAPRERARDE